ncbi:MAG: hypothetical protein O3B13_17990 [Planctomycetota bacterium]|nr:hypothetical protein [Planctomycetota bacterium]MDA1164991.1 hypothetical protein [Planctomycetota bacterium]
MRIPRFSVGRKSGIVLAISLFGRRSLLLALSAIAGSGCGANSEQVSITGLVMLDGLRVPAEIRFEQLNAEGVRVGRSATAFADENGHFSTSIEPHDGKDTPVTVSLVVRVSQLSDRGLPTVFDETVPREKIVRLKRTLTSNVSLTLLTTR